LSEAVPNGGAPEGLGHELGVGRARRVVQILHGRVDVRVTHPLRQLQDRNARIADDLRAEGVAQVMKA
jgi:hypothetical protein